MMREEVYMRNVKTVYRICLIYLKNVHEAEDETSNVFISYLKSNIEFTSLAHEKAWFITAAKNRCKNVLKSFWKIRRTDLENLPEQVANNEEQHEILEQLFKLKDKYRIIIYLYYFEGYSTVELSKILDINENTIRTRLRQARKNLKIILEEDGYCGQR